MEKKNILTGIRPTGNLHLGHYFGAVRNWVALQKDYNTFIEIADVQALTDNFDNPEKIRKNVRELVLDLLACGINPEESTIFIQSKIPEIAEQYKGSAQGTILIAEVCTYFGRQTLAIQALKAYQKEHSEDMTEVEQKGIKGAMEIARSKQRIKDPINWANKYVEDNSEGIDK